MDMLCSIIVILIANVAGDEVSVNVPLDKGVMVLGDDTLQSVLDSNSLVLVDFYAPWFLFLFSNQRNSLLF